MTKTSLETITLILKDNMRSISSETYVPILHTVIRELKYSETDAILLSALWLINHVIWGEEKDVKNVLDAGILDVYEKHLGHERKDIRWCIFNGVSNIAA